MVQRLPDFEAWAIFARVAEHGSFAAAATELGLSAATVSKAVARLENRLGERLIHRSSRRFSLTEAGRALVGRATRILAEGEAAETVAAEGTGPRGRVRLAAPMSFGIRHVAPALPDFMARYPAVSVDLRLDDRVIDVIADGIDIALRIAALADSSLVARRLCPVRRLVVGAPSYFERAGRPRHPADLSHHACLGYSYLSTGDIWSFTGPGGEESMVRVSGPITANNGDALMPALEAGLGLALQPEFICWEALRDRRLEAVLMEWTAPPIAIHAIMPPGGPRPARVAVLLDHLVNRFAAGHEPWAPS